MSTLLIVDDEPNLLRSLRKCLQQETLRVLTAETANEGIQQVRAQRPDVVLLDVRLPDMSGLDAFQRIHEIDARLPVILITAYSTTETAIEAMKRGAYEYLLKPVDVDRLQEVVDKALQISRRRPVPSTLADTADHPDEEHMVGRSPAMQEVYKAIGRVAPQDVTVLILGESGTGKEMVAWALYQHSRRSHGPFLAINCAALPETLLESELFGHEHGSFTGADRKRIGKFEQVDGGTVFLDEIGDMSSATQAKVLRLLQQGTFERVGGNETLRVDVRVIAATNKNLEALVHAGGFREDLFYRLKVFTIELPPLRRRREDLPELVEHFVRLFNRELGRNVRSISPEAMRAIQQFPWPGNVRELQSAIKYALIRTVGDVLTPEWLPVGTGGQDDPADEIASLVLHPDAIRRLVRKWIAAPRPDLYRKLHGEVDRLLLPEVLKFVAGNQVQASDLLGISRSTLRAKISDLGLTFEKRLQADTPRGG